MKKTVSFSIVALIGLVAIAATMKISDYPAKTYLTGTELFLLADGSTNAKMTATSLNAALTNVAGLRIGATIAGDTITLLSIPILRIQTNTIPTWPYAPNNLIVGDGGQLLTTNTPWPVDPLVTNASDQSRFIGQLNAFFGFGAGGSNSSGYGNVFAGALAGTSNTIGDQNVFVGWYSGFGNVEGYHNTYLGAFAGQSLTNGNYNTVVGCDAVGNGGAMGDRNTAIGSMAGGSYLFGSNNTYVGTDAGRLSANGQPNTFVGSSAGYNTAGGNHNVAMGYLALRGNVNAHYNVAIGDDALIYTTNNANTGVGYFSLSTLTNQSANTALGYYSGLGANSSYACTFLGYNAGDSTAVGNASTSTALGFNSRVTGDHQIMLGTASETVIAPSSVIVTNNINALDGVRHGGVTVATLPGTPMAGQQVWVTDVLTSRGAGDLCYYDGAAWRTREHVVATADKTNFVLNGWAALLNAQTPISSIYATRDTTPGSYLVPWRTTAGGTGGSVWAVNGPTNTWGYVSTSTSASGTKTVWANQFQPVAGDVYGAGGEYYVPDACSATETYSAVVGMLSANTTANLLSGSGVFFLYDMYTNNFSGSYYAALSDSTMTNRWICVVAKAGTCQYFDSGLTPSTSQSVPDRLAIVLTTAAVTFYTNGVACKVYDTAANLPASTLYTPLIGIKKSNGTTERTLREAAPFMAWRRAAMVIP